MVSRRYIIGNITTREGRWEDDLTRAVLYILPEYSGSAILVTALVCNGNLRFRLRSGGLYIRFDGKGLKRGQDGRLEQVG